MQHPANQHRNGDGGGREAQQIATAGKLFIRFIVRLGSVRLFHIILFGIE
jgi:hypothetical protein